MSILDIFLRAKKMAKEKIISKKVEFDDRHNLPVMENVRNELNNERKSKYCHYCCSYSDSQNKFCKNCGLPLPDKEYELIDSSRSNAISLDIAAIIRNIQNNALKPPPILVKTYLGNDLMIKPILTNRDFIRYYPSYDNRIKSTFLLKRFTVIDFETANMYPDSVCQMGVAVVENNEIIETKSFMIRPPYNNFKNFNIHGITLNDVKNAPTFAEAWDEIKPYIENSLIGAYNADFDIGCMLATLENFKITTPNFAYFDILRNARESLSDLGMRTFKLSNIAKKLKIKFKHHDALNDAIAAANVQLKLPMSKTFSFVFASNNRHFELMAHLIDGDEIFKLVKESLKEKSVGNDVDYLRFITLISHAEDNGADEAKCLKLKGEIYEAFNMLEKALECYKLAYSLNNKVGVKGKIQKLEHQQKK